MICQEYRLLLRVIKHVCRYNGGYKLLPSLCYSVADNSDVQGEKVDVLTGSVSWVSFENCISKAFCERS